MGIVSEGIVQSAFGKNASRSLWVAKDVDWSFV